MRRGNQAQRFQLTATFQLTEQFNQENDPVQLETRTARGRDHQISGKNQTSQLIKSAQSDRP